MSTEQQHVRGVTICYEPPDLAVLSLVGVITEQEAHTVNAEIARLAEGTAGIFVLADVTQLGSMPADVRKVAADTSPSSSLAGIAILGASFHSRILLTLLMKAIAVFRGYSAPLRYFDAEAEARVWIAAERKNRRGR
jgi:hypothetical protein